MKAKYLTSVELNPLIKTHLEVVEGAAKIAEDKFKELNAQGVVAQTEFEKVRDENWEKIKEQMHSHGLITAEEKQFGIFQINQHKQMFITGIDQSAKDKFEDEQEEKELAAEEEAQEKGTSENTESQEAPAEPAQVQ